ncbi:DHH family phosphoesterase [Clostridium massiliamazoniense]|uniref:DHH family phosphoesterase n=1 Tax=Clostridium massiliamazoniense TaxID=1347366 RepID=UPI0006D7F1FA|nr:bifunctional oligoribonuclease/PAP phosphatase NrnA [Clostridium massiliamazoniense]
MRLHEIAEFIKSINKIAITFHVSPDGDAMGSALALLQGLRNYGKEAYIISKDVPADNLGFLPYTEEITGEFSKPVEGTEAVIVVDCGNYERISADLKDFKGKLVNIDHHLSNDLYGDLNYTDTQAAATAEIIFELLTELNIEITREIARTLYASLVTDTGSFRYSNTTPRTHSIAKSLLEKDIAHDEVHRELFDNKEFAKLKLTGAALNNMELICNGKIVFISITEAMIKDAGLEKVDSGDIVSFGNKVKGTEGCVLAKESSDGIKLSFRSKDTLDVRKIAENFNGGGHTKAAGAIIKNKTMSEAKELIIKELEKELM